MALPHEMASGKLVLEAVSRRTPSQSNLATFEMKAPDILVSFRNAITVTKPGAQKGRLIQKNASPGSSIRKSTIYDWPGTDPMAHTAL
jgi:hypothetical protein